MRILLISIFISLLFRVSTPLFAGGDKHYSEKSYPDKDQFQFDPKFGGWEVGQTATYDWKKTLTFPNGSTQVLERQYVLSIVRSQIVDGKTYLWFEMDTEKNGNTYLVQQYLLPPQSALTLNQFFFGDSLDILTPVSVVLQRQNNQAVQTDLNPAIQSSVNIFLDGFRSFMINFLRDFDHPHETILTPGGEFEAAKFISHVHGGIFSMWVSSQVPILGTVKVEEDYPIIDPQGVTIKLKTIFQLLSKSNQGAVSKLIGMPAVAENSDSTALIEAVVGGAFGGRYEK